MLSRATAQAQEPYASFNAGRGQSKKTRRKKKNQKSGKIKNDAAHMYFG
jgi:hypothetical protein